MNTEHNFIVVQHTDLEEMLEELHAAAPNWAVVRVWAGSGAIPLGQYGLAQRWHLINVQAAIPEDRTILSCAVVVGVLQEMNGRPFGPEAEGRHRLIQERLGEEALERIKAAVEEEVPQAEIRPGSIHTGLDLATTQRAYWSGLQDLYQELKKAPESD